MVTVTKDNHQIKIKEEYGIKGIFPIKLKEEPSTQYAVINLTDKEGLPEVPVENFNRPLKVVYDSYTKYDVTDESD